MVLVLNEISELSRYSRDLDGNLKWFVLLELTEKISMARVLLVKYAQNEQTLTYREFASELNITKAPVIASCAQILEALTVEDVTHHQPILSALVVQQGSAGIPRLGFYQQLNVLNVYQGDASGIEATDWHQQEIVKLKKYYIS